MPHEDTDMEETETKIPDTKDMDGDDEGSSSKVSKEELKQAMREVQLEDRLKYTVDCRSEEELNMIIKMAQQKLADLKKNPKGAKSNSLVADSKY